MKQQDIIWEVHRKTGPLVATAIHHGHQLRNEAASLMSLHDDERLREEDPFTGEWTAIGDTQLIGLRSRFEVDLNRPRENAVYIKPEDAWGLHVWKNKPSPAFITQSLAEYDAFYENIHCILTELTQQFGHVVVFDLHSYNHRRQGPDARPDDPGINPEVNIGTGTMDRTRWAPLVNRFMADLQMNPYSNRQLDVRENVKFKGGQFSHWIHQSFPTSVCSISIEFKKFFMDEWTGKPDHRQIAKILAALKSTVPGIREELNQQGATH